MPKIIAKRGVEKPDPPPKRILKAAKYTQKHLNLPGINLHTRKHVPDDVGFSCAFRGDRWVIIDRYSYTLEEQPDFATSEEARAFADNLNDALMEKRFP